MRRFGLGQPFCISRYDCFDTVDRDFGRLLPARLRRLMFAKKGERLLERYHKAKR